MEERKAYEITKAFIEEFAELNLELAKQLRGIGYLNVDPDLLLELRENAQALVNLSGLYKDI